MKKAVCALLLAASVYGFGEIPAAKAATAKAVSLQLTINSPGANGSQFVLQGLQTPASPVYTCSKTNAAAAGNGTSSVSFVVVDLGGVNKATITVSGTQVGTLAVTNAKYVNQSGSAITGNVTVKQLR